MDSPLMLAEGEGFKPPIPERGIPDFESSAIDHSANLPFSFADAKVILFSETAKKLREKFSASCIPAFGDDVDDDGSTDERGDGIKRNDPCLARQETDKVAQ